MIENDKTISEGLIIQLKNKIDEVERSVNELEELGKGLPMIDRNASILHSFIYVLKKDVSSVADVL